MNRADQPREAPVEQKESAFEVIDYPIVIENFAGN